MANDQATAAHWRVVARVAVRPSLQGRGPGRRLMGGLHERAAALGLDHPLLSVRDGLGLDAFYERLGYRRCGVHPGALRMSPDDVRDEIFMVRAIEGARPRP